MDSDSDEYSYTYSDDDYDYEDNSQCSDVPMNIDESEADVEAEPKSRISGSSRKGSIDYNTGDSDGPPIRMTSSAELYTVLNARVNEVSELFQLRQSVSHVLFRRSRWNKERLCELFTSNPEKLLEDAGVTARYALGLESTSLDSNYNANSGVMTRKQASAQKRSCAICFEDDYKPSEMVQMPCKHEFCIHCWKSFVVTMMKDGHTSLLRTCPQDGCNEIVTEEEVAKISPECLPKYQSFQLRSFVHLNETCRWCPGPGCERIAALSTDANGSSNLQFTDSTIIATCDDCSTSFCLKCGEEPHAPLACKYLSKWHEKCRNESETANWILANTKACRKCGSRIEKNQGCNHMICQQCKHEFCWICQGDWVDHGATTGGYYRCNKFDQDDDGSGADQSDAAKAKRELDRYLHYYKRYHGHEEAQKFAKKQLKETEERMMRLQETSDNATWTDVEYLKTANEQLVECRRVLKYTYCFAYYLPERSPSAGGGVSRNSAASAICTPCTPNDPTDELNIAKMQKDQFEYHQEMLERFTESLSELVEKPLKEIHRESVVNKTRVVNNFMKNILKYVEDEFL